MGNGDNTSFIDLILIRGLRIAVPSLTFSLFNLSPCSLVKWENKEGRNLYLSLETFRLKSQVKIKFIFETEKGIFLFLFQNYFLYKS